jgi:hypothetical protein
MAAVIKNWVSMVAAVTVTYGTTLYLYTGCLALRHIHPRKLRHNEQLWSLRKWQVSTVPHATNNTLRFCVSLWTCDLFCCVASLVQVDSLSLSLSPCLSLFTVPRWVFRQREWNLSLSRWEWRRCSGFWRRVGIGVSPKPFCLPTSLHGVGTQSNIVKEDEFGVVHRRTNGRGKKCLTKF